LELAANFTFVEPKRKEKTMTLQTQNTTIARRAGTLRLSFTSAPHAPRQPAARHPLERKVIPPNPRTRCFHPHTGENHFGFIPFIKEIPNAHPFSPIVLLHGRQNLNGNGKGVCHIWGNHALDLKPFGVKSNADVELFVAAVLREGTPLFYENAATVGYRIAAFREGVGRVILGLAWWGWQSRWEVISAFPTAQVYGEKVGCITMHRPHALVN
jgi:hypothetical protein